MKMTALFAIATACAFAFAPAPSMAQDAVATTAQELQSDLVAPETVQRDLDALYAAMQAASVDIYAFRSKADFDAFHAGLRASVTRPLTRLETAILFQRFAAFARIGHIRSNAWLPELFAEFGRGAKFAPIFIRVERDGRVLLTDNANADGTAPAGAQLLAIDGEPVARILARVGDLVSAERPYMAHSLLEQFFPALITVANPGTDEFEVELMVDDERVTAAVPTLGFGEYQAMSAAGAVPSPPTDFNAREFRMIDADIGYLRPGPFGALEGEEPEDRRGEAAMIRFLDESFAQLLASGASDLIIDLRNNPGGDVSFSDPMIAWIADRPFSFVSRFTLRASAPVKAHYDRVASEGQEIGPVLARLAAEERAQPNGNLYPFMFAAVQPRDGKRFEGRVWALVNRASYSNATTVAAMLQDYGFATILGEETADVPTSFASIFPYILPATGMSVDLAKSYFVRPSGSETLRGVIPDRVLPRQEIGSSSDTMLAAALELVREAE